MLYPVINSDCTTKDSQASLCMSCMLYLFTIAVTIHRSHYANNAKLPEAKTCIKKIQHEELPTSTSRQAMTATCIPRSEASKSNLTPVSNSTAVIIGIWLTFHLRKSQLQVLDIVMHSLDSEMHLKNSLSISASGDWFCGHGSCLQKLRVGFSDAGPSLCCSWLCGVPSSIVALSFAAREDSLWVSCPMSWVTESIITRVISSSAPKPMDELSPENVASSAAGSSGESRAFYLPFAVAERDSSLGGCASSYGSSRFDSALSR